jgi:hypothetical protein
MAEKPSLYEQLKGHEHGDLLAGSKAKLDRAGEHLKTLKSESRVFREKRSHAIGTYTHPDTGNYFLYVSPKKVPPRLNTIAGDVLSNLRPALDYMVFALAKLDAGETKDGTQFPICDTPERFNRKKAGWLKGLSAEHVTAIEKLQPYDTRKGMVWLRWLRDLSNPDKHQDLNVIATDIGGGFEVLQKPRRVFKPKKGETRKLDLTPQNLGRLAQVLDQRSETQAEKHITFSIPKGHKLEGSDVYVQLGLRFDITFDSGLPVVEALEVLHSQTREIVQSFDPEFEG